MPKRSVYFDGILMCPKCKSLKIDGCLRENYSEFVTIDWGCKNCGCKWSVRYFWDLEHDTLTVADSKV